MGENQTVLGVRRQRLLSTHDKRSVKKERARYESCKILVKNEREAGHKYTTAKIERSGTGQYPVLLSRHRINWVCKNSLLD